MRIVHVVCAGLLVAATPAVAASGAGETVEAKDKVVCKRARVTGSLAQTKKVCGTRQFWEERTRNAKEWTRDLTDKKQPPPGEGGGI
jgi:hypothetical protein